MNISNGETRKIKAIDRASVHRICSGQVVLTLATAVKELVENSIDAGATNIEVKLKEYGSELIEVADNGCGVKPCDYESLTLKHHTSKLGEFTDLLNIDTFGFRGEALSSLCALSKMTIVTCHRESDVGSRLEYDHDGRLLKQIPTARQTGTTVVIENLFSTLPVRHREFQKNLRKEYGKMIQLLTAYCLISTGKRITCVNNTAKGKKSFVLSTNGEQSVRGNISCIYGNKQVSNLMEFKQKNPSDGVLEEFNINSTPKEDMFRIEGYLSPSTHGEGRSSSDRQFFFIDGRPCDLPKVSKIINDVYHGFNRHQYPFICLNISLLKGAADVNVTPDKRQIFIPEEKWLLAVIKTSVSSMYEHQPSTLKNVSLDFFKINNVSDSTVSISSDGDSTPNKTPSLSQLKRSCDQSFEDDFSSLIFKSPRLCKETGSPQEVQSSDFDNGEVVSDGNVSYNEHQVSGEGSQNENSNERCLSEETASLPVRENKDHINFTVTLPFKEDKGLRGNFAQSNSFKNFSRFARDPKPSCSFSNKSGVSNSKLHVGRKNSKSKQTLLFTPDKSDIDVIIQQHELDLKNCLAEENRLSVEKVESEDFSSTFSLEEKTANGDSEDATNSAFSISVDENQRKKRKYVSLDFLIGDLQKSFGPRGDFEEEEGLNENEKYRKFRSSFSSKDAELELQKEISKDMFAKMEIIGQFNLGFIITKFKEDLFIIDQHATDEKYNFEILQRDVVLETQKLLNPQTLALTTDSETILLDNLSIFEKNGFKFNIFEEEKPGQRVQLVSVPVSQNWRFGKDDVDELIFMLSDNVGKMCRPSRVCQMFASRACRKSVMIGTSLSHSLMKKLICHMGEIEQPWNCPHGRPTMRHLFNMNLLS